MKAPSRGARTSAGRKRAAGQGSRKRLSALDQEVVPDVVLGELIRRIRDIETAYRDVAEKMGQLYIYADRHDLATLTREFDQPMRNASDSERAMASILDELQLNANRRQQGGN